MLLADIKGKLSFDHFTSEDFLTSSVFSSLMYLGDDWLQKYLKNAIRKESGNTIVPFPLLGQEPIYLFWPWYATEPQYGYGAEPDVVILIGDTAVIIEAKNYSGKSGEGIIDIVEGIDAEEASAQIVDQLGREYFVGTKQLVDYHYLTASGTQQIKHFYIIFLTRHASYPDREIKDTVEAIGKIEPGEKEKANKTIYWLNWQKVRRVLDEVIDQYGTDKYQHMIAQDLSNFLERRGLRCFTGFKKLRDEQISLTDASMPETVMFYKYVTKRFWEWLKTQNDAINKMPSLPIYMTAGMRCWDGLKAFPKKLNGKLLFYGKDV